MVSVLQEYIAANRDAGTIQTLKQEAVVCRNLRQRNRQLTAGMAAITSAHVSKVAALNSIAFLKISLNRNWNAFTAGWIDGIVVT